MNPHFTEWDKVSEQIETEGELEDIILRFVDKFCELNKNGPTIEEISKAVCKLKGYNKSGSHINYYLLKLEMKGEIASYRRGKHRVPGRIKRLNKDT